MFKRLKNIEYETLDSALHPEHETRNTRVSEYLRKYGQGKIDALPQDTRATVTDPRTPEEMIDSTDHEPTMADEQLDVMLEFNRNLERFQAARDDIELTQKQRTAFDDAVKVLQDDNSSFDAKQQAYELLDELTKAKKVTRARS